MARMARNSDKEALGALWRMCFDDPPAFVDWFMDNRFLPAYCTVAEREGLLAAAVHAVPLHIRVRDAILPCAIMAGVATDPAWRGQGLMHEIMAHMMNSLRAYGIPLAPHRPAKLGTFFSIGHYPVSDSAYAVFRGPYDRADDCVQATPADASAIYRCYAAFARRYSGMIQRSYADFTFKCADYLSCGAQCVAAWGEDGVEGYCIYFDEPDELYGEECAAISAGAYERVFRALKRRAAGKALRVRLPGDVQVKEAQSVSVQPRSVLGVADVSALLRAVGLGGLAVEVTDAIVPQNNGVFDLRGEKTDKAPALRIAAGRLAQWAVGYKSMAELVAEGCAELILPDALPVLDSIGKRPCYIIDEY